MKIVERFYPANKERWYGITEVDVVDGKQTYPYEDKAEAMAELRLLKLKERGAKDKGKFRDRQYESALKATDRI